MEAPNRTDSLISARQVRLLVGLVLAVHLTLYVVFFTDWLQPKKPLYTDITIELAAAVPFGDEATPVEEAVEETPPEPSPEPPPEPEPEQELEPEPEPEPVKPPPPVEPPPPVQPPSTPPRERREAVQALDAIGAQPVPTISADYAASSLNNPIPPYPPQAFMQRLEGQVILRVHVRKNGKADKVQIYRSSGHQLLDNSALETVQKWRFNPARRGDTAVDQWVEVPINFSIRRY